MASRQSIPSHANPRLIKWAREAGGFASVEELAESLPAKVPGLPKPVNQRAKTLLLWESHRSGGPSFVQLSALAKFLKRPVFAFYLPEPPEVRPDPKDFRPAERAGPESTSPALRLMFREAREIQDRSRELIKLLDRESQAIDWIGSAKLADAPREAAERLRVILGATTEEQEAASGSPQDTLRFWLGLAALAGVTVMRRSEVSASEFLGFSLTDRLAPLIALNTSKEIPLARVVLALLHELSRLLLGVSALSGGAEWDIGSRSEAARVESWCNQVACELLLPWEILKGYLASRPQDDPPVVVRAAAMKFGVSSSVVVRQLRNRGQLTRAEFERLLSEFSDWEPSDAGRQASGRQGPGPAIMIPVRRGARFVRLAMEAFQDGLLSPSELQDYLGVSVKPDTIDKLLSKFGG